MGTRSLFCLAVVSMLNLSHLQITHASESFVDETDSGSMNGGRTHAEHIHADRVHPDANPVSADRIYVDPNPTERPVEHGQQIERQEKSNQLGAGVEITDGIKTAAPRKAAMVIVVDKEKHLTHVLQSQQGQLVDVFQAQNTTGKASTPTPEGRMLVANKRWDPIWTPPVSIDPKQRKVASYSKNKNNPLGVAWLGLSEGFIGLHGTNDPKRIGRNASHGCVRHKNEDIRKLYGLIPVGTPVYIVGRYSGTRLHADDVNLLNGHSAAVVVARANANLNSGWYPTIVE